MRTYVEVEQGRKAKGYVYYDFKALEPSAGDTWSTDKNYCKYFNGYTTSDKNGKVICLGEDVLKETRKFYDINEGKNTAWGKINEALEEFPGATYDDLKQFEPLLITSALLGDRFYALWYALCSGAKINADLLVSDIRACQNKSQLPAICKRLTEQVHAAAINAMFVGVYQYGNDRGKAAKKFEDLDKKVEQEITDMYKKYVLGINCKKPILIPDCTHSFSLPEEVFYCLKKHKNESGLKQGQVLKMVREVEKIIEGYVKG